MIRSPAEDSLGSLNLKGVSEKQPTPAAVINYMKNSARTRLKSKFRIAGYVPLKISRRMRISEQPFFIQ